MLLAKHFLWRELPSALRSATLGDLDTPLLDFQLLSYDLHRPAKGGLMRYSNMLYKSDRPGVQTSKFFSQATAEPFPSQAYSSE